MRISLDTAKTKISTKLTRKSFQGEKKIRISLEALYVLKWCGKLNCEITNEMWNGIFDYTESSAMLHNM